MAVRVVKIGALRPADAPLGSVAAAVRYGVEVTQAVPGASPRHLRPAAGCNKPIWLPDWAHLSWRAWPQVAWMLLKALVRHVRRAESFHTWSDVREALDVQALTATKADMIHFDCCASAARYPNLPALLELPYVVTCGCDEIAAAPGPPPQGRYPPGPLAYLSHATAVHCASAALASAVEAIGIKKERIRVIGPAVDTERFKVADQLAHEGALRLLYVGPFSWRQGHEYVLLGIRKALDRGAQLRFRMLGDGPDRQRIQFCVLDLGIGDAVTLTEDADGAQTRAALEGADAFVATGFGLGIARAALEAMSLARTVIVSDWGGTREIVTHGVDGFVVPPRDPDGIADAIIALQDAGLRRRMGLAARERIVRDCTVEAQASRWAGLYHEVLSRHRVAEATALG